VGGKWVLLEDLTFTSTNSDGAGVRVLASNVTVRRILATNNKFQGIWLDNSDVLVEDSVFSNNGSQGNGIGCMGDWDSNPGTANEWDPSHCHGIYGGGITPVSGPTSCTTPHHVTVRRNIFRNNGGSGFQQFINPSICQDPTWGRKVHDYLIENNIFEDNGIGMFAVGLADTVVRNNTFVMRTYPAQQTNRSIGLMEHADTPNTFKFYNNIFVTPVGIPSDTTHYVVTQQNFADRVADFNFNGYFTQSDSKFRGDWGSGFLAFSSFPSQWKSTSQKDANSITVDLDATAPGFVSLAGGDYHLLSSSPARNAGTMTQCASEDFDKNIRADGQCDMGAFEFGATATVSEGGTMKVSGKITMQ